MALAAGSPRPWVRRGLLVLALVWIAFRLPNLASVEGALARGSASAAWDPSLRRIGELAAKNADRSLYVASDWGVATQIYCLSNGRPEIVREPFWHYKGPKDLDFGPGRFDLYLVRLRNPPRVVAGAMERIERDLAADPPLAGSPCGGRGSLTPRGVGADVHSGRSAVT